MPDLKLTYGPVGVILCALLCGSLPFDDESIPNLFKKIKSGIYSLPSHLSQLARNLIPRMLEVEPMKRITHSKNSSASLVSAYRKLPPYLRHPPDLMEKQERVVDPTHKSLMKSWNFLFIKHTNILTAEMLPTVITIITNSSSSSSSSNPSSQEISSKLQLYCLW